MVVIFEGKTLVPGDASLTDLLDEEEGGPVKNTT